MVRRHFLQYTAAFLGGLTPLYSRDHQSLLLSRQAAYTNNTLPIPPLAEYKEINGKKQFHLNVRKGEKTFINNVPTKSFGVNGDFLGPTLKVTRGEKIRLSVQNTLDEQTTMHWHGLHVAGKNDGGPHQVIDKDTTFNTEFTVDQRACTAWYHPHQMDRTGYQVYMGIAGFFFIDDKNSQKVPHEYGVDDIPLVIQDRRFDKNGQFDYVSSMHDRMMGVTGDVFLINGAVHPTFTPQKKLVRFRILNGSNSRIYSLGFDNKKAFDVIASDGGFFEKPQTMRNVLLSPGERVEIIVKFHKNEEFKLVDSISKSFLMQLAAKEPGNSAALPKKIAKPFRIAPSADENVRYFDLTMGRGVALINNKKMDMSRIDETVALGTSEIWRIRNNQSRMMRMAHPFHVHGCSFEIIKRDKRPIYPFEQGAKDTVLVAAGEVVDIRVIFHKKAEKNTPYMYHCHNLEHEDLGMMGQFSVT
ncbi:MAG: multicopper oxidase family protein [Campylobacterota bacterium]